MPTTTDLLADSVQQYIPIVVGVTGHRDLRPQDMPVLAERVRTLFTELRRDYPSSPLLLLSPLAEGADRLAAAVALEFGARLVAALPMAPAEFEDDFPTARSRAEFRALLARAARQFVVPPADVADRTQRYAMTSEYIARQSHLLVALWSGVASPLSGGTAFTVKTRLEGLPGSAAVRKLDAPDAGPVYHIVTPRVSDPQTEGEPFSVHKLLPPGWRSGATLAGIDRFNRDLRRLGARLPAQRHAGALLDATDFDQLSPGLLSLLRTFAGADMLALYFQKRRGATLLHLILLGLAAAGLFGVYAHLLPVLALLVAYPLALGAGYGYYFWVGRRDYQNRHLDYRALAEGLRVQFFWRWAGIAADVPDVYLRKQRGELEWIRSAIRACLLTADCGGPTAKERVQAVWVHGQRDYFERTARKNHGRREALERAGHLLFLAGLLLIVPVGLIHLLERWEHLHHWLVTAMGLLPAVTLALDTFAEKTALAEQSRQYERMGALFARAAQLLADADPVQARLLLEELGREALAENGDWVLLHRHRSMPAPKGG